MVSQKTLQEIAAVLCKHLSAEQIRAVVTDLQEVKGNKSFMDTIKALATALVTFAREE